MPKPLLIVKHAPHEGPGLLSGLLGKHAIHSRTIDLSLGNRYPDPGNFSGVISLGGPQSANDRCESMLNDLDRTRTIIEEELPYLGICLGMQVLVKAAGGEILPCETKETGFFSPDGRPFTVALTDEGKHDPLFEGLGQRFRVFQLHGETAIPCEGISLLAEGTYCRNQIVRVSRRAYGIQSHFELTEEMFRSWLTSDPHLQAMDGRQLIEHYLDIRADYEKTGTILLENFLRIAELI